MPTPARPSGGDQDPSPKLLGLDPQEVQAQFADLLGLLSSSGEVRVPVSMRDDFLFPCQAHEALAPIADELTLLGPPTGAALHRALVQRALSPGA